MLEGRPVRWAARLTPHGHDTLTYGLLRPRAEPAPAAPVLGRPVELIPSQMAALRVFVHLADRLRISPAAGLAEQVRTASCEHGIKRWRLYLTEEQIASVAYGFWLHRMTGSAAEANRFSREYGTAFGPSSAQQGGLPAGAGTAMAAPGAPGPSGQGEPAGEGDGDRLVGAAGQAFDEGGVFGGVDGEAVAGLAGDAVGRGWNAVLARGRSGHTTEVCPAAAGRGSWHLPLDQSRTAGSRSGVQRGDTGRNWGAVT